LLIDDCGIVFFFSRHLGLGVCFLFFFRGFPSGGIFFACVNACFVGRRKKRQKKKKKAFNFELNNYK